MVGENLAVAIDDKAEKISTNRLTITEKFARSVARNPCKHYCGSWALILSLCTISVLANWLNLVDFAFNDWVDPDSESSQLRDAYLDATEVTDTALNFNNLETGFRTTPIFLLAPLIMYEWADKSRTDDIVTPENLEAICEFEKLIFGDPDFPLFCVTEEAKGLDTECDLSTLPLLTTAFYQNVSAEMDCTPPSVDEINFIKLFLLFGDQTKFFFDVAVEESVAANSLKLRSTLPVGGPLGPDSTNGKAEFLTPIKDDVDESYPFYQDFFVKVQKKLDNYVGVADTLLQTGYATPALIGGEKQLEVRYYSIPWEDYEFDLLYPTEFVIVFFSIIVVGFIMFYHTKSCFITTLGISANMTSIVVGVFFYRGVFQVDYYTAMHSTILFIIVGIGADNIFVFYDSWKQSEYLWPVISAKEEADKITMRSEAAERDKFGTAKDLSPSGELEVLAYRMQYTLSRASTSIFNTTATTFAAFLATSFNDLAPISAFGVYAALVLMSFYFYVFLFYAPMMIINELKLYRPSTWICCKKKATTQRPAGAIEVETKKTIEDLENELAEAEKRNKTLESKLFEKLYIPLMLKYSPWLQIFLIVLNVTLVSYLGIVATELSLPDSIEEVYAENHMYHKIFEDYSSNFAGGEEGDFVPISWSYGIEGIDRNGFDEYDPNGFRGNVVFTETFDIAASETQKFLLGVCEDLRTLSCIPEGATEPLEGCRGPTPELVVFPGSVKCILEDFYDFVQADFSQEEVQALGDTDPDAFYNLLQNFSLSVDNSDVIGFIDDEIVFLTINFAASIVLVRPSQEKKPVHALIFELQQESNANTPSLLGQATVASQDFAFIEGEKTLVPGLFSGLAIAFGFAFIVLLFGTDNFILAIFALISIIGIVISLLGTIKLIGWDLGFLQVIASVMVVGLAVDYTVHVGHTYEIATLEGYHTRVERFTVAAERMGPTVFMGYITTASSAALMLLCQITFFPTMGLMILLTVSFSLEVALFFYLSLLLLFGPEGEVGKVSSFFKCLFCWCF